MTFPDENGGLRARWLGKPGDRQAVIQRLADLISRADGKELYENWLNSMERMVVRSTARKLMNNPLPVVTPYQLRSYFIHQQRSLPAQPIGKVYSTLRGLLSAHLVQWFQDAGLGAQSELFQDQWLELHNDFAGLLFWDMEMPLLKWLENMKTCPSHQEIVEFYEGRSARLTRLHRGLLNKLHCWLVELY